MWENVGMSRNKKGLEEAITKMAELNKDFWQDVVIPGRKDYVNQEIEKAGRVADFLELGQLMARDALEREESCGGHFREEHQTEENEARRNDADFSHVSAWEYGEDKHKLHKESLSFEYVKLATRSYK